MTGKEAIKVLLDEWKCIDRNDGINCDRKCEKCDLVMDSAILKEAYNMAIKALEQEPCDECKYKTFTELYFHIDPEMVEQELCDDVVSRQAVLKTLDDMDNVLDEDRTVKNYKELLKECYEVLPPVRPKPETVTEFADRCRECGARYGKLLKQEPKAGHWIRQDNTKEPLYGWYFCSECNSVIGDKTKFCSNCGARMVEPQESEDKE